MAVAPTGAIYKALEFDGVSSRAYGVYITGEAVYNAPERAVEMITIPGRSGSFALDNGRFENITVTYPAGIFAETEADFRDAISEFRNFLCSRKGYVRLQDEYNPNEYRMAVYKSGLEVEPAMLKAGEFEITFDCKPQRWLTSGETAVTIGEWGETETATGDIVTVENEDGILGVKSLSVALDPIQEGSGTPSPDNVRPISGRTEVETVVSPTTSAEDGDTYTTALGRTVYGGTLDVVSGELVVDRAMVDLGSLNWTSQSTSAQKSYYSNVINDVKKPSSATSLSSAICSAYSEQIAESFISRGNGVFCISQSARINVNDNAYSDAETFKTAMNGVQLCYELATPTTYQLTPTEVSLLLGNNNVWSEDGEVTVEYGQLPNLLINPTLFEASPLLEVEGYGTIGFNGYEIELENAVMGDVLLADKKTSGLPTFYNDFSLASLNAGDTITVNGISVIFSIFRSGVTISSVSDSNSDFSTTYKVNGNYYYFTTTLGSFTGQKGTYVGKTNTTVISGTNSNGAFTINVNYTLKLDNYYQQPNDGFCSIEYAYVDIVGHEFPTFNSSTCGTIRGNSTMSLLGNPTYVDCDLGECYLINGGDVVSLNAYIDLGSKLPTLAPGSNAITFDNTITDLKITPRWWKV